VKDIQLILSNPCSQQWDDMQQVESGRHCESCKKNVYDLTASSDAELLAFFKNKKENVCGRVHASQLNRTLNLPAPVANWKWLMPLAITAVATTPAKAQSLKPVAQRVESSPSQSPLRPAVNTLQHPSAVSQRILSGTVIDSVSGKPLRGVKIRQSDFYNVLAITDTSGRFELHADKVNLIVPCSFELFGQPITAAYLKDNMTVKMSKPQTIHLGGIVTVPANQRPLLMVISGKKKCFMDYSAMNTINPNAIENLNVLKGTEATAVYGSKAANGVLVISIKKEFADQFDFSKNK
jgi:TonB-dependent SusC/RagA subfamily outer membrane receptor